MRKLLVPLLAVIAIAVVASYGRGDASSEKTVSRQTSPLADFLGFGYHADREDAAANAAEAAQETFVQTCMTTKGFSYWPETPIVKKAGLTIGDGAAGKRNDRFRDSLSPARLTKYQLALNGRLPTEEITDAELQRYDDNRDGEIDYLERGDMGCRGAASVKFPGLGAVTAALAPQLAVMEDEIAASDIVADGRAAWANCMNALGFAGDTVDAVFESKYKAIGEGRLTPENDDKIEPCNDHTRRAFAKARLIAERKFFEENETTIRNLALRP